MRDTLRLGRIAGVPIGVNWSVLLVATYLAASLALGALPVWYPSADLRARLITAGVATLLFLVSILLHELGHAAAARRHGVEVDGITLWVLGGVARLRSQAPTPRAEFEIAAAGPAASLAVAGAAAIIAHAIDLSTSWGLAASAASWLAIANALVAISNLVPVAPLDGGRVLTAALWRTSGDAETARLMSARAGLTAGSFVIAGAAIAAWQGWLAWWWAALLALTGAFVADAARREIHGAAIRGRLARTRVIDLAHPHPPSVPVDTPLPTFAVWAARWGRLLHPVTRSDGAVVGWIAAAPTTDELGIRTVAAAMVADAEIERVWTTETLADVVARIDLAHVPGVVAHDPRTGEATATLTASSIEALLAPPDLWGRAAAAPPPPRIPPAPVPA